MQYKNAVMVFKPVRINEGGNDFFRIAIPTTRIRDINLVPTL
jgi:hypothetical protein